MKIQQIIAGFALVVAPAIGIAQGIDAACNDTTYETRIVTVLANSASSHSKTERVSGVHACWSSQPDGDTKYIYVGNGRGDTISSACAASLVGSNEYELRATFTFRVNPPLDYNANMHGDRCTFICLGAN